MNRELAICIPSYKRASRLAETLEAFLPQVASLPAEICVVYDDDGPDTLEVLRSFRSRYPHVVWETDPSVKGIDRKMASVVALASARYAWLFGDDDIPQPNAVERVLAALRSGSPAMVVVNGATYDSELRRVIEPARLRLDADRTYGPGEHARFMSDTASYITYLGGVVIDRALWSLIDPEPFYGTDYLHVAVSYRAIVGRPTKVIAEPLIKIRLGGATWADRYFQVELVNWPGVVWGLPSQYYPDAAKRAVCERKPISSFSRLLATRAYGYFGAREYQAFVLGDAEIPAWRRRASGAILRLPVPLAAKALSCYRRLQSFWGNPNVALTDFRLERHG